MARSIEQVQRKLGRMYLGKEGVHAVGIRTGSNSECSVVVYIDPAWSQSKERVLTRMRRDAEGFCIEAVDSEPARVARVH